MTDRAPRVLIVDDEESMRFFLRRALGRRGFETVTAEDGPAGLEAFIADPPDAVLLDVRLPGMNGRDVLERIRALDADVPVIVMTGYATVDDAMGAMWAGATDYVRKPLRADDVAGALDRALAARGRGTAGPATVRSLATRPAPREAEPVPAAPRDPESWLDEETRARGLPEGDDASDGAPIHRTVRRFERVLVDELLRRSGGNVARAARSAGVSRPNFHRKMRALGLDADRYRRGWTH